MITDHHPITLKEGYMETNFYKQETMRLSHSKVTEHGIVQLDLKKNCRQNTFSHEISKKLATELPET